MEMMLPREVGGVDESIDIDATVDVTELTTEVETDSEPYLGAEPTSPDADGAVKLLEALTGLVICDIRSPLRFEGLLDLLLLDVGLGSGW